MTLHERHFVTWDGRAVEELQQICRDLPVLTDQKAAAFFDEAERATEDSRDPNRVIFGELFGSFVSTLGASDRQDFDATWELDSQGIAEGVLMVESHDPVIATLCCIARVHPMFFLTRTFSFGDIEPVKRLRSTPVPASV